MSKFVSYFDLDDSLIPLYKPEMEPVLEENEQERRLQREIYLLQKL